MKKKPLELFNKLKDWLDGSDGQSRRTPRKRDLFHVFQLEGDTLKELEKIAKRKNLALQTALEQAIHYYGSQQGEPMRRVTEERKERNPLLRLEGLLSNQHQDVKKMEEDYNDNTRIHVL